MSLLLPLLFGFVAIVALAFAFAIYYKNQNSSPDSSSRDLIQENAGQKAQIDQQNKIIGQLTHDLQAEKSEKDQLSGKGKQLFVEITSLKEKLEGLSREKEKLASDIAHFQSEEKRKNIEFDKKISQLEEARNALEDEKKRIRKEDEEKQAQEKENRDRMWAEHEESVKAYLSEICRLPQYNFSTFDNKNLPEGFSGKLKPDFMIEFLGQYIIFDAKVSRSENLQSYVSDNVKKTADKINSDPRIYPMIFFVVPNESIATLTRTYFQEQGYDFFIISRDAIPAILSSFKKMSAYELAEQLDPRDRENIVNLIAEFDHHINMRNALDIIASQTGIAVLGRANNLKKDLKEEIKMKKSKMRIQQPSSADLKSLMVDSENQQEEINSLTSPRASVPHQFIKSADSLLQDE